MTQKIQLLVLLGAVVFTTFFFPATNNVSAVTQATVSFNRDIRPILSNTCFLCHGPDKSSRKAGLRLDLREEALKKTKSGITPIVPGKPDESEIIRRIFATDQYEVMPPRDAHKDLTAQQKELIKRWVAEGAVYEGHWAYQAIQRPAVPAIPNAQSLVRNPIDAFIQARLAQAGLQPAPEADRRTLLRRVTLDLTGLPPTPQEIAAFVQDKTPDAYEKVVDRLLASPRYAEKQTMHWLDAVRYADTAGFHGDNPYPTWPYRDYVLRAFRNNKPFDQFTREQLAGDLLPNATSEQRIASAYNRLNRVSAEGGVQPKEYLAKYGADRVRTTSNVWLGATMGCAECHDHKFDPILTKDFYAMKAFFADIQETGLVPDRGREAWGSKLRLATPEQERRLRELTTQITAQTAALDAQAKQATEARTAWEARVLAAYKAGQLAWKFQRPIAVKATHGATLTTYNEELVEYNYGDDRLYLGVVKMPGNGIVIASGANPDNETYTITIKPGAGQWTALGLQLMRDLDLPGNHVARGAEKFVLTEIEATLTTNTSSQPLKFVLVTPDAAAQAPQHPAMSVIDGNSQTGWSTSYGMGRTPFIALRLAQKLQTDAQSVLTIRLRHDSDVRRATIGRFRLALSDAEFSWPESDNPGLKSLQPTPPLRPIGHNGLPDDVGAALQIKPAGRSAAQQKLVLEHFKWSVLEFQEQIVRLAQLQAEHDLLDAAIPRVLVTETTTPDETRILPRGNWMDESGQIVAPAVPVFLGKLNTGARRGTRLDLANWLVAKDNPLTARVFVNRQWRQFFGVGLSKVLDDFGSQGEWPVHAELLDWLAAEFRDGSVETMRSERGMMNPKAEANRAVQPWNIKALHRLIVTSATYRQSSIHPSALSVHPAEIDPENRLLAHQNRFRVEAEVVRDIALSVSGLLVEKFGGPSVKPPQPENYLAALNFPRRDYAESHGADLYRRGVYTHWQRTFLHPSLLTFDAPTREECTVNRVNSNTPLQALVLLNDPIYVEAARVFAQHALQQTGQIAWAFAQAIGRQPSAQELRVLTNLHRKSLTQFQRDAAAAQDLVQAGENVLPRNVKLAQLAAMMTVTRAILNLHETITRN